MTIKQWGVHNESNTTDPTAIRGSCLREWSVPFVDVEAEANREKDFWVLPEKPKPPTKPYLLRFAIIPNEHSTSAFLEIHLDLPEGHNADEAFYSFQNRNQPWPIEGNVFQSGELFYVYLPELEKGRLVEFIIGWQGAPFDQSRIYGMLNTDTKHIQQDWGGWKLKW